jgi:hypothetical protein
MQQLDVEACRDLLSRGATLVGPPTERAPGGGVGERSVTSRDATFARALAHIERHSPAHVNLVKQLVPFAWESERLEGLHAFEARRLLVAARHAAVAGNVSFSRECLERLALFYRNTEPDACKENQHALLSEVPFLPQDTV